MALVSGQGEIRRAGGGALVNIGRRVSVLKGRLLDQSGGSNGCIHHCTGAGITRDLLDADRIARVASWRRQKGVDKKGGERGRRESGDRRCAKGRPNPPDYGRLPVLPLEPRSEALP